MNFLERLKTYMNDNNVKQIDIINNDKSLSKGYVSMVVNGKRQPNTEILNALSQLSGKSINWWLHGVEKYDNLYSLNELIDFFIDNGSIDKDGNMDSETKEIINTMLKKEIRVKLKKKYFNISSDEITDTKDNIVELKKKEITYDDFETVAAHNDDLTYDEISEADRRILADINKRNKK